MDTRKQTAIRTLSASSLVEVLTALVILLVIIGLATSFAVKLIGGSPDKTYLLHQELPALAHAVKTAPNQPYEAAARSNGSVQLQLEPLPGDSLLLLLELQATGHGRPAPAAVYRELVWKEDMHEE